MEGGKGMRYSAEFVLTSYDEFDDTQVSFENFSVWAESHQEALALVEKMAQEKNKKKYNPGKVDLISFVNQDLTNYYKSQD
jgi:hypothetical protein